MSAAAEHGVETAIHTADDAIDAGIHAATRGMSGLAKAVEKALSTIFSFFGLGEPKLTPMQRELAAKAEEELAEARAWRAAEHQNEAARDWEIFEKDRRQQQDEHERNLGYREDPGVGNESANDTSRLDGDSSRQSKNRTIAGAIKGMFKAAAKLFAARDDEAASRNAQAQGRRERERRADSPPCRNRVTHQDCRARPLCRIAIRPKKRSTIAAQVCCGRRRCGLARAYGNARISLPATRSNGSTYGCVRTNASNGTRP